MANAQETALEKQLAKDLIRFVLLEHMKGLRWKATGIFSTLMEPITNADSPFTPQLKRAVKEVLDFEGHTQHIIFDGFFPDKSVVNDTYLKVCQKMKDQFVSKEFYFGSFISFCVILATFAGLSYHYGKDSGPSVSYFTIIEAVAELKKSGKFNDNTWREMHTWLENRKIPSRKWETESQ